MYKGWIAISIVVVVAAYCIADFIYKRTTYAHITHISLLQMLFDAGNRGEFNIFQELSFLEKKGGRFLFNVYLPYKDGTTEIDVLLLYSSGVYVFESKNYSGWIFGSADSRMWTQSLPQGKGRSSHKEKFLNPIFQNALHLRQLKTFCESDDLSCYSFVVFSDGCTLKSQIDAVPPVYVCHTGELVDVFIRTHQASTVHLTEERIQTLYDLLYPRSQCTEQEKQMHIDFLNQRHFDHDSK